MAAVTNYPLPTGIDARTIDGVNGMRMHVLEAGTGNTRGLVVLLHGFPELAFSWRKVMLPLAAAGYHVVAPDQRGYGRTSGWEDGYDITLRNFHMLQLVRDTLALVYALGYDTVHTVVGHDFGSPLAAYCALARPDVFRSVVLMSAPFGGAPPLVDSSQRASLGEALAQLARPRKHYQWYYATREANADMLQAPQGLASFLRAYYHVKSADWAGNAPHRLGSWQADELARLPTYYVMDLHADMPQTVAPYLPDSPPDWLRDAELAVYAQEFGRTGFQGGLNWYRCNTDATLARELGVFANKTIDVPSAFFAGTSDWGVYQTPGAFERMQDSVCTDLRSVALIDGAGHWVQQEQPEAVCASLLQFCDGLT